MTQEEIFLSQKHGSSIVQLRGFVDGTTPADVADLLWTKLGWSVDESCISISPHTSPFVTVILTRFACADFISRQLQQAGSQIRCQISTFGLRRSR